ncbi:MAG: SRPBCC domain-containing protein [Thermoplasmata archaeon]|nr:SRPBCC domain-containing protein [Thermoplasmata archaeon]
MPSTRWPLKVKRIRQTVVLPGSPSDVYEALMTTKGHQAFTGASARINGKVGGRFMAWGGYIHGTNLKLIPGKLIVQSWVPSDTTWPKGHESTVRYELSKTPRGTRVVFTHSDVPSEHVGHLSEGWKESYWTPLRAYLSA